MLDSGYVMTQSHDHTKLVGVFSFFSMRYLFISLSLLISTQAYAARPFMTDDARLTTEGSCQLESWARV